MALIQAVNRYDSSMGATFRTYAFPRVRGAICDYLRDTCIVSRTVQKTKKRIEKLREEMMLEIEREPTHQEIIEILGISRNQLDYVRKATNGMKHPVQYDAPMDLHSGGNPMNDILIGDALCVDKVRPVEEMVERLETITEVRDAISRLSPIHQAAIRAKYFTQAPAKETAVELGVTVARVSILNRQSLDAMRGQLSHIYGEIEQRYPGVVKNAAKAT